MTNNNTINTNTTNNTINTNINDFFARQAKKEDEAIRAWIDDCVNTFGAAIIKSKLEDILRHLSEINQAVADVTAEENTDAAKNILEREYKKIANAQQLLMATKRIPESWYESTSKQVNGKSVSVPVEFSDRTNEVFDEVCKITGVSVVRGKGKYSAPGNIYNPKFAKYIIQASGDKPDVLLDIIDILKATLWDKGNGITLPKMEIVYHTLILHWDRRDEVKAEIIKLLKKYDLRSLKGAANDDDRYRNHLKYEEKMMMLVEDTVCAAIGVEPLFKGKVKKEATPHKITKTA